MSAERTAGILAQAPAASASTEPPEEGASRLVIQSPLRRAPEGGVALRWPVRWRARRQRRVSVRLGNSLRVGMDTTNDGRIDTVLEAPRRPSIVRRALVRLLGWLPFTAVVRWCVRQGLRWLALGATPTQLYACQKICTGALALAELRAQVDRACADGECSVEVQRDLEDVVIGVEDTLQRTVELVLEQLDVNGDGRLSMEEALGILGDDSPLGREPGERAGALSAAQAAAAVVDAARGGQQLLDELRSTADEAFDAIDTTRDGKISAEEALAAPGLLLEWWRQRSGGATGRTAPRARWRRSREEPAA